MGFRESRNLLFCSLEKVASFLLGNVQWERASFWLILDHTAS